MSLTYTKSTNGVPIAKTSGNKIIYLLENSKVFPDIPKINIHEISYTCPYCKHTLATKHALLYHLHHACKKKSSICRGYDVKPSIELDEITTLFKLPLEFESIMVCGPPGCGKSYWVNEYVKRFKELYINNNKVFLITRLEHDTTIENNIDDYVRISIDDNFDQYKMEDFENSVVIFDDIESAEYKKGTASAYALLDDISKNGRHHNISVIFCNQECRMGKKTKCILTVISGLVVFMNGNHYQMSSLLRDHVGMNKAQVAKVMTLPSRWAYISRRVPQYILHQKGIYLLNKPY